MKQRRALKYHVCHHSPTQDIEISLVFKTHIKREWKHLLATTYVEADGNIGIQSGRIQVYTLGVHRTGQKVCHYCSCVFFSCKYV